MPKFLLFLSLALFTLSTGITSASRHYREAPQFFNSPVCSSLADDDVDPDEDASLICSDQAVHVATNLDTFYIRGSMAAILSVLQHSCPENIVSHFIASASFLRHTISLSFSYLNFRVYQFDDSAVSGLISTSIRSALDCPLSYARSYLANLLPLCVRRVVYLDSDLILVDDVAKLASHPLDGKSVLATPEYCNANFTATLWSNPSLWELGCPRFSVLKKTENQLATCIVRFRAK